MLLSEWSLNRKKKFNARLKSHTCARPLFSDCESFSRIDSLLWPRSQFSSNDSLIPDDNKLLVDRISDNEKIILVKLSLSTSLSLSVSSTQKQLFICRGGGVVCGSQCVYTGLSEICMLRMWFLLLYFFSHLAWTWRAVEKKSVWIWVYFISVLCLPGYLLIRIFLFSLFNILGMF